MSGVSAQAPAIACRTTGAALDQPAFPRQAASLATEAPRALILVSELEDYMIAFANGVACHLPVTVAVPRRQYGKLAQWFDPAIDLHLMDWPRHRSLANPRFLLALGRLVRCAQPQVIHLLSNNTIWLNLIAPLRRRIPLVTTIHDISVHPGDSDTATVPVRATTLMARQSDHLVVHGERLRALAQTRFGKPADRIHVVPHPAIIRYRALADQQGLVARPSGAGLNVLMFGRIFAYKGLATLLRAEALLQGRVPGLKVVIAGRGDDPMAQRQLMGDPARYDVRHRFIEDAEVAQLFLDTDLVVLPYAEGSQSGVLHLAAAFGKPVVVTDVGELGRTVRARAIGLVVPPDDPGELADAIATLAAAPALRAGFGANARAWADTDSAPETVGAQAAALYHHAIKAKRR